MNDIINEGEFIKLNTGEICRVTKFLGSDPGFHNMNYYGIDILYTMTGCNSSYKIYQDYIIAHSWHKVDLLNEGDYINGYKIIYNNDASCYCYFDYEIAEWVFIKDDTYIETVATKEQFQNIVY